MAKLISLGTKSERVSLYIGWVFAGMSGAVLPSFIFMLGPVFDSFGPSQSKEDSLDSVSLLAGIIGCLAVVVWITSYLQHSFLTKGSIQITNRIRNAYLSAVLSQESAWYDMNEYTAMASRI